MQLVRRNRRRYGGYIVHAGVAVALIGVAGSTSFQHSREATIGPGQSVNVDGYRVTYLRPTAAASSEKISLGAWLGSSKGGRRVATLHTELRPLRLPGCAAPIGPLLRRRLDREPGRAAVIADAGHLYTVISPNITPLAPAGRPG